MVAEGWRKLAVQARMVCSALEARVGDGRVIASSHMDRMGRRKSPPVRLE